MSAMRATSPKALPGALSMRVAVHAPPLRSAWKTRPAVVPKYMRVGDEKTIENTPPLPEGTVMVGLATAGQVCPKSSDT